eukprot:g27658.t1
MLQMCISRCQQLRCSFSFAPQRGSKMGKRTKKVGVVRKYGTRYGASLRKVIKKVEISQHKSYVCGFCGKDTVKREAVGIWKCRVCKKVMAGGAYTLTTATALTVRSTIRQHSTAATVPSPHAKQTSRPLFGSRRVSCSLVFKFCVFNPLPFCSIHLVASTEYFTG